MANLPVGIPLAHQPCQTDLGLLAIATFLGICIYSWISGYCHFNSCPVVRPPHWCCRAQSLEEVDILISSLPARRIAKWVSWYTLRCLCTGQVCIRFGKEVSWFFLTITVVSRAEIHIFCWHCQESLLSLYTSRPDVLKYAGESSQIILAFTGTHFLFSSP